MSSCPFRRASSHVLLNDVKKKGGVTSRQNSVQILTAEDEQDDCTTLNLKHLSLALEILTAPPVSTNKSILCDRGKVD